MKKKKKKKRRKKEERKKEKRKRKKGEVILYLENSGCFLMTSLRVASTAAMVSSEVPTSRCGLPLGSFCTRSRIAYFPKPYKSSLAFFGGVVFSQIVSIVDGD